MHRFRLVWGALALAALVAGCDLNRAMTTMAIGQQIDYINAPGTQQARLERVSARVWTYNWYFDRTLVIDTDDGLVVVDPFSPELVSNLRRELDAAGLRKPVHTVIYSHYHMDHTRGAAALSPRNVLCHARCAYWWERFAAGEVADVQAPTGTLEGDTSLTIGGVEIELLYLANAHTDTNYAVFLPEERVLYAADTVALRSLLPVGGVSIFMPDYLAALCSTLPGPGSPKHLRAPGAYAPAKCPSSSAASPPHRLLPHPPRRSLALHVRFHIGRGHKLYGVAELA